MKFFATLLILFTLNTPANALTTGELLDACAAKGRSCDQLPFANIYIGGALDLLGTLNEKKQLKVPVLCSTNKDIFDVKRILQYMEKNREGYNDRNAMHIVIKYFEEAECVGE